MYREKLEELDSNFEETEAAGSLDMANRLAAQQRLESENQYLTSLVVKVRPAQASLPKPAHTSLLIAPPLVMRNIQPPGPKTVVQLQRLPATTFNLLGIVRTVNFIC
jgi:hypothetical protein